MNPGGGIEILECVFKSSRNRVEPERGEQMMNIGGWVSQSKAMVVFVLNQCCSVLGEIDETVIVTLNGKFLPYRKY